MNGTANVNPASRSHYTSSIPVPRALAHSKQHTTAPPSTPPGLPIPSEAPSPRPGKVLAPGLKTLKPKGTGRATSCEPAKSREGSPSVPHHEGQNDPARPLVSTGRCPKARGSGKRGAGRAGEPTELFKAPLGSPGRGTGVAMAEMGDELRGGSQGRGPVFGSGAITFSSAPPHSHPVTATVAPFQYR